MCVALKAQAYLLTCSSVAAGPAALKHFLGGSGGVESPKKIDQVHADACRDSANRARAAAGGPSVLNNQAGRHRSVPWPFLDSNKGMLIQPNDSVSRR